MIARTLPPALVEPAGSPPEKQMRTPPKLGEQMDSDRGLIYRNLEKVKSKRHRPTEPQGDTLRSLSREARKSLKAGLKRLAEAPVKIKRKAMKKEQQLKNVESPKIIR